MQVNKTAGDLARTEAVQRPEQAGSAPTPSGSAAPAVRRTDAVQISDEGRALAADQGGEAAPAHAGVDPARAAEIRSRILSGAYHSVEMADNVARAILRSGDL